MLDNFKKLLGCSKNKHYKVLGQLVHYLGKMKFSLQIHFKYQAAYVSNRWTKIKQEKTRKSEN